MTDVFTYIDAICNKKEIDIKEDYSQFLINRFFSYFRDTCLIAQMISRYPEMDNELHFKLCYNLISKRKRFTKWYKSKQIEEIKAIATHFDSSFKEASLYKKLISKEYLNNIIGVHHE